MSNSPIIWNGKTAKNLTGIFKFKDNKRIISGSADPTAVAQDALEGSLYMSSNGTAYIKNDNGSTTNWSALSTGGGGGGTPGGSNTQVQFNDSGAFGGAAQLFWDKANNRLGVNQSTPLQSLDMAGYMRFMNAAKSRSEIVIIGGTGAAGNLFGNGRGLNAVDIQASRSTNAQVASGSNSQCFGNFNTANGAQSFAGGYGNSAGGGSFCTAVGVSNSASANFSSSFGYANNTSGAQATGVGNGNTTSGTLATSVGTGNTSTQANATAVGSSSHATGSGATAVGSGSTASGFNSTALGNGNSVSGISASGVGVNNAVSGSGSSALGVGNSIDGNFASTVGTNNVVHQVDGTVVGTNNTLGATGSDSALVGTSIIASGASSAFIGANFTASGIDGTAYIQAGSALVQPQPGKMGVGVLLPTSLTEAKLQVNPDTPITVATPTLTVSLVQTFTPESPLTQTASVIPGHLDSGNTFTAAPNYSETGFTATGLTYTYSIRSYDGMKLSAPNPITTFTDDGSTNPFGVDLSWGTPLVGTPTGYYLSRTSDGGATFQYQNVGLVNSFTDDNTLFTDPIFYIGLYSGSAFTATPDYSGTGFIATGLTYTYSIQAYDGIGFSVPSPISTFTDDGSTNPFGVNLTWSVPILGTPTGYYLSRTSDGGATFQYQNVGLVTSFTDDNTLFLDPIFPGPYYPAPSSFYLDYVGGDVATRNYSINSVYVDVGTYYSATVAYDTGVFIPTDASVSYQIQHDFTQDNSSGSTNGLMIGAVNGVSLSGSQLVGGTWTSGTAQFIEDASVTWAGSTTNTPQNPGYLADGTTLNRGLYAFAIETHFTVDIYSPATAIQSIVDPNDSNYYEIDCDLSTGTRFLIVDNFLAAGIDTVLTHVVENFVHPFTGSPAPGVLALPFITQLILGAATSTADPAQLVLRGINDYSRLEFQDSTKVVQGYIESSGAGIKISGGLSGTYNFDAVTLGNITSMTFLGGILTAVTTL